MSDDKFDAISALEDVVNPPWLRQLRALEDIVNPPWLRELRALQDAVNPPWLRSVKALHSGAKADPIASMMRAAKTIAVDSSYDGGALGFRKSRVDAESRFWDFVKKAPAESAIFRAAAWPHTGAAESAIFRAAAWPHTGAAESAIFRAAAWPHTGAAESAIFRSYGLWMKTTSEKAFAKLPRRVPTIPMFSSNLGMQRVPALNISGILKAAPSTSEIAGAVDAVFNAIRAIECRADPEHFDSASYEADDPTGEGEEAAEASGRSEGLWVPSASKTARPWVPLSPVRVFLGASRRDDEYKDRLMKHLCVLTATGAAELWSESDVLPGEDYELTVSRRLELSSFVVLLLSADYLYELYMRGAMQKLEERAQQATLIPVLTSPVDIRGTFVERISPLPADGRFITTWSNTEEAWFEVARALRDGLEACRAGAARILN